MRDPTDLVGLEEDEETANQLAELQRTREVEDFKWLMKHEAGRRFMWRVLSMTGVFRTSMTGDNRTFFNEGARSVGLQLMAELNDHSIEAYVKMLKERQNDV